MLDVKGFSASVFKNMKGRNPLGAIKKAFSNPRKMEEVDDKAIKDAEERRTVGTDIRGVRPLTIDNDIDR